MPALVQRAFGVQVEVGLGDLRAEAVGVVDFDVAAVPQARADTVRGRARRPAMAQKKPCGVLLLHGRGCAARDDLGGFRLRQERAHLPARLAAFFLRTACGPRTRNASPW